MDARLRDLRLFLVLADELHFSQAAAVAGVSQPTLTRAVARLERDLGAPLVARTTRSVSLTPAGQRLRDGLGDTVPRLDAVLRSVADGTGVRLGFTWLLPSGLVREVSRALEQSTGARVELVRRDDPSGGVLGGTTDLAVVHGPGDGEPSDWLQPSLRVVRLATEPRVAAVGRGHALGRRRRLAWAELAHHPLVVNAGSGTVGPALWPASERPEVAVRTATYDEWIEMVAAGRGVGVLPRSARRHPHPGVRYVEVPDAPPSALLLVRPARGGHPLAAQLEALAVRAAGRPGVLED